MHEFRFCAFVSKGAKRIKSTDGRAKGEALTDLYIKKRKRPEEGTRLYQYINKILSINITRLCCCVALLLRTSLVLLCSTNTWKSHSKAS